jgi:hypothetical protein
LLFTLDEAAHVSELLPNLLPFQFIELNRDPELETELSRYLIQLGRMTLRRAEHLTGSRQPSHVRLPLSVPRCDQRLTIGSPTNIGFVLGLDMKALLEPDQDYLHSGVEALAHP